MLEFIEVLRPMNVFEPKVRIGPPEDGGYVVPDILLDKCTALISYGVGQDIRFEAGFSALYLKHAYMHDHTIGGGSWDNRRLHFMPEGLGREPRCRDIHDHYKARALTGEVFVKIDVDGAEYDYFERCDIDGMSYYINGFVIEFHYLNQEAYRNRFVKIMKTLNARYLNCHIHGNNWSPTWSCMGYDIPETFEITLINRRYVRKYELDTQKYPVYRLDAACNGNSDDIPLDFLQAPFLD